jgi:hypothetical protein
VHIFIAGFSGIEGIDDELNEALALAQNCVGAFAATRRKRVFTV